MNDLDILVFDLLADSTVYACRIPNKGLYGYSNNDPYYANSSFDVSPNDKYFALQSDNGTVACFENPVHSLSVVSDGKRSDERLHVFSDPAKDKTIITFSLAQNEHPQLTIVDAMRGFKKTILDHPCGAGVYTQEVDTRDMPSGLYFVELVSEYSREYKKMLIVH